MSALVGFNRTKILWVISIFFWSIAASQAGGAEIVNANEEVEFEGAVVCLAEEMHAIYQSDLSSMHQHLWGFRTKSGEYFTLLRTRTSEAIFADEQIRKKRLLLKGRVFGKSHLFEPTVIRSIVQGKIYDLFYYCDICSITSITPGLCDCCQGPNHLVEKEIK